MNARILVVAVALGILATTVVSPKSQLAAQQPACLHGTGEGQDQQLRKRQALTLARQINTAEVVAKTQTGAYQPIENLSRVTVVAPGFVPHLAVDASGYAFSIKDSMDPCGFAFFSDQSGTIYQGEALR